MIEPKLSPEAARYFHDEYVKLPSADVLPYYEGFKKGYLFGNSEANKFYACEVENVTKRFEKLNTELITCVAEIERLRGMR